MINRSYTPELINLANAVTGPRRDAFIAASRTVVTERAANLRTYIHTEGRTDRRRATTSRSNTITHAKYV